MGLLCCAPEQPHRAVDGVWGDVCTTLSSHPPAPNLDVYSCSYLLENSLLWEMHCFIFNLIGDRFLFLITEKFFVAFYIK